MASPGMVPRYRRSLAGPIVLITIGLLFLLRNIGVQIPLFRLFAKGWPLLLILWGVIKLVEHYQAQHDGGPPARIGSGGVVLLIFIVIAGAGLSTADHFKDQVNWGEVRDELQMDDDVMRMFGSSHTYDQQVEQAFPDKGSVKIVSDHGNVSVSVWDQKMIRVVAHKRVFRTKTRTRPKHATRVLSPKLPSREHRAGKCKHTSLRGRRRAGGS